VRAPIVKASTELAHYMLVIMLATGAASSSLNFVLFISLLPVLFVHCNFMFF
jgi:hypothetical protein